MSITAPRTVDAGRKRPGIAQSWPGAHPLGCPNHTCPPPLLPSLAHSLLLLLLLLLRRRQLLLKLARQPQHLLYEGVQDGGVAPREARHLHVA